MIQLASPNPPEPPTSNSNPQQATLSAQYLLHTGDSFQICKIKSSHRRLHHINDYTQIFNLFMWSVYHTHPCVSCYYREMATYYNFGVIENELFQTVNLYNNTFLVTHSLYKTEHSAVLWYNF